MTDKHDDALIAEAERLANIGPQANGAMWWEDVARHALELQRSNWQPVPEPDRAGVLAGELWKANSTIDLWEPIIRRHFDELRAEWEADRRAVVVVPDDVREGVYVLARFVQHPEPDDNPKPQGGE